MWTFVHIQCNTSYRYGQYFVLRHRRLEIMLVTLSEAKGLVRWTQRSFAALRMTGRTSVKFRSREVLSPNVCITRGNVSCRIHRPYWPKGFTNITERHMPWQGLIS